jgi:succinate-acetate transporter protein
MDNLNQNQNAEVSAQINLSDAKTAQTMGVVSIVITFCTCCYGGLIAIIVGVLAMSKAKKAISDYEANPSLYSEKSYNQAKTAKTLSLIGIIIGALGILYIIFALIFGFASALTDIASKGY